MQAIIERWKDIKVKKKQLDESMKKDIIPYKKRKNTMMNFLNYQHRE